jgi:hypothetical protein
MGHLTLSTLTTHAYSRLRRRAILSLAGDHDSLREGATLGIIVATGIWVWLVVVDAVAGHPFQTFATLGGITIFTGVHYLLNIVYGVVIVSAVRGATREPSLALALVFGLVMLEIAIAMLTVLLSHLGLGELAWVRIFGGSLVGVAIALFVLSRHYPLASQLRHADHRTKSPDDYIGEGVVILSVSEGSSSSRERAVARDDEDPSPDGSG